MHSRHWHIPPTGMETLKEDAVHAHGPRGENGWVRGEQWRGLCLRVGSFPGRCFHRHRTPWRISTVHNDACVCVLGAVSKSTHAVRVASTLSVFNVGNSYLHINSRSPDWRKVTTEDGRKTTFIGFFLSTDSKSHHDAPCRWLLLLEHNDK